MPVTVKVNGVVNSLVHKGSSGVSIATIPDVCKTPTPTGPVPMPYPNISQSGMLAKGTTTVKADGGMMIAIKGSEFSLSNGDEPGVAGGVKSSTFIKESTWILYSFDVKIEGKNACRLTDKKFHNHENTVNLSGEVQSPSPVPPALTPLEQAIKACEDLAKGRKRGKKKQSYDNCGVESSRQLINKKTGKNLSEDSLLDSAMAKGQAEKKGKRSKSGATHPWQRKGILASNGVPSSLVPQSMSAIDAALSQGKGVIVSLDSRKFYGPLSSGGHALVVVGVVKDKDGKITEVIVNDSGTGECGKHIPADKFEKSLRPGRDMNVTDDAIWK